MKYENLRFVPLVFALAILVVACNQNSRQPYREVLKEKLPPEKAEAMELLRETYLDFLASNYPEAHPRDRDTTYLYQLVRSTSTVDSNPVDPFLFDEQKIQTLLDKLKETYMLEELFETGEMQNKRLGFEPDIPNDESIIKQNIILPEGYNSEDEYRRLRSEHDEWEAQIYRWRYDGMVEKILAQNFPEDSLLVMNNEPIFQRMNSVNPYIFHEFIMGLHEKNIAQHDDLIQHTSSTFFFLAHVLGRCCQPPKPEHLKNLLP